MALDGGHDLSMEVGDRAWVLTSSWEQHTGTNQRDLFRFSLDWVEMSTRGSD